jgi:hypothetical protein
MVLSPCVVGIFIVGSILCRPCALQVEAYQHAREHSERLFSSLLEEVKTLRSDMVRGCYTPTVGLQDKPIPSVIARTIAVLWLVRVGPLVIWKVGVVVGVIECMG